MYTLLILHCIRNKCVPALCTLYSYVHSVVYSVQVPRSMQSTGALCPYNLNPVSRSVDWHFDRNSVLSRMFAHLFRRLPIAPKAMMQQDRTVSSIVRRRREL